MSKTYYPVIGLEIHAELKTKSKMFCGCRNNPDEEVQNTNICPICMAHPGTLPVPNKQAIKKVIEVGLALNGEIADFTEFDRKNYFYPDIPKGYQISQYKYPIVSGGSLLGINITRVHLEEDTGTSKHDRGAYTLVDYNRAGVPLMELVTEPVIHDAKTAGDFARALQTLFRFLDVSEANMEKGEMRVEANISLSDDPKKWGTKVEVKNLNSFKSVEKAISYELTRMEALYEANRADEIIQETRGWDEIKQNTFSQRSKESAHDYRYFPDPDIPKFYLSKLFDIQKLKEELPELPESKTLRYKNNYGLKDADIVVCIEDKKLAQYFEDIVAGQDGVYAQTIANYLITDVLGNLKKDKELNYPTIEDFKTLGDMIVRSDITSRGAKDILLMLMKGEIDPEALATKNGLLSQSDEGVLTPIIQAIIVAQPKIVGDYKGGKEAAFQALLGLVMKETKGSANPIVSTKILKELL